MYSISHFYTFFSTGFYFLWIFLILFYTKKNELGSRRCFNLTRISFLAHSKLYRLFLSTTKHLRKLDQVPLCKHMTSKNICCLPAKLWDESTGLTLGISKNCILHTQRQPSFHKKTGFLIPELSALPSTNNASTTDRFTEEQICRGWRHLTGDHEIQPPAEAGSIEQITQEGIQAGFDCLRRRRLMERVRLQLSAHFSSVCVGRGDGNQEKKGSRQAELRDTRSNPLRGAR